MPFTEDAYSLKAYSDKYNTLKVNEDTFLKDTLVPILRSYFENSRLIYTEGYVEILTNDLFLIIN